MGDESARLALPLLVPGQAQKEMTHNEALARLDIAVTGSVVAVGQNVPPVTPSAGACWVIGDAPIGEWAGQPGKIAGWTEAGWRFVAPWAGAAVWNEADGTMARFVDAGWTQGVLAGKQLILNGIAMLDTPVPAVILPAGGASIDAEARAAIAALCTALRHHRLMADS